MKTKIVKKLISIVCAATMATSCVSMSVGAVPKDEATEQAATEQAVNWKQEVELLKELINVAESVKNKDCVVGDCESLVDQIHDFMNRDGYKAFLEFVHSSDDTLVKGAATSLFLMPAVAMTELKSGDKQQRRYGSSTAIDYFNLVIEIIESGLV